MTELDALRALADPGKAADMLAYHKTPRTYLGVGAPQIDDLVAGWRAERDVDGRVALAQALWDSDLHEARLAAAKLLVQARIRPDAAVWALIAGWAPQFDGWAIADQAMIAGQKRLVADPARLDEVEGWLDHPNPWTRRAALVGTLPWAKMNNPKPAELQQRERVLDWAAGLAGDPDPFVQRAIAAWLRDLSKRDAPRVQAFLAEHGPRLRPAARNEIARLLQDR